MDLRLVEIFCYVYQEMSFSRAAERLGLTQPTISGHIKTLEQRIDTRLFDRLGREIAPTRAGELLYVYAEQIVELKRAAAEAMNRFLSRLEGRLVLGASTIPGEYLMPARIARFRDSYPNIEISMVIHDTRQVVAGVRKGEIDLGFVGAKLPYPTLSYEPFARDRVVLVVPAGPEWAFDSISLAELRNRPLLVREEGSGTRMMLERALSDSGLGLGDFHIVAELGSTTAIKEAVKTQLGAAFVSSLSVESDLRGGLLRKIEVQGLEPIDRSIFTVINNRRASSPLREAFLEFLADSRPRPAALAS
ncbi:MAG: LysR family transcriptional regulator [Acidobacteria bacterium]|nr:MAG: LysR family transcriptional regulator [Acidobacteriota bacterium]